MEREPNRSTLDSSNHMDPRVLNNLEVTFYVLNVLSVASGATTSCDPHLSSITSYELFQMFLSFKTRLSVCFWGLHVPQFFGIVLRIINGGLPSSACSRFCHFNLYIFFFLILPYIQFAVKPIFISYSLS